MIAVLLYFLGMVMAREVTHRACAMERIEQPSQFAVVAIAVFWPLVALALTMHRIWVFKP